MRVITLFLSSMSSLAIGSSGAIGADNLPYEYDYLITYLLFDLAILGVLSILFVVSRMLYKPKIRNRY